MSGHYRLPPRYRSSSRNRPGSWILAIVLGLFLASAAHSGALNSIISSSSGSSGGATTHSHIVHAGYRLATAEYGWTGDQLTCLNKLWTKESGWNPYAANPTSDARGIPQNINGWSAYAPGDFTAQIKWGLKYIDGRYKSPCAAWDHEVANNWY